MNATKGIQSPSDLAGRRVGELHRYGHDAGIWAKGARSDDFGVKASSMVHYVGGMERTVTGPDWAPVRSAGRCDHQSSLGRTGPRRDACARRNRRALHSPFATERAQSPDRVRRLFPDFEDVERDYFRRTGIFPIMHTVVIRRDVYDQNRWIARALMQAFEEAKTLAMKAYNAADVFFNAPTMIPWFVSLRERNRALMGENFWPYGIEANRKSLEACLRHHREQGILKRSYNIEELFAPETLI